MTESKDALVSDLHMKAAYSSAQELARKALCDSVVAVKYTEEIAKTEPQSITD